MVPLADVLNVYFQNGSYKSIASPANSTINGNTIAALSDQALAAFSYFDNVAQQETIFAGTQGGIQQLKPDGTWIMVPFISSLNVGLIGASMSFSVGNFANTNKLRGSTLTFTTGVMNPVLSGIAFVAGSYFQTGTTWSGLNRQHHVGPIPSFGTEIFANIEFGSLESLMDVTASGSFLIIGTATNPGQSAFTSILSNGVTQTSANSIYSYDASLQQATWQFPNPFGFAQGTTYQVLLA